MTAPVLALPAPRADARTCVVVAGALLVNAVVFALVFLWLQRCSTPAASRARAAATVFAAAASLVGGGQLAVRS